MNAREYHDCTKHSLEKLQADRHFLDWEIQPLPFKIYRGIEPISLPHDWPPASVPALEAIASPGVASTATVVPDLRELARLLYHSAGIVRVKHCPGGQKAYFRAAACTGALYHIDLYLVCGELPDLSAGVYHFGPHDFSLRQLRPGDHRGALIEATGGEPAVAAAPALVICSSTFWRNAWKYRARAYRHCFWDNGTILANLLAVAAADDVPARLVMGFVDSTVNRLLGLDTSREVALSIVALGHRAEAIPPAPPAPVLSFETEPLSTREVDYPEIHLVHEASSLASAEEAKRWRGAVPQGDFQESAAGTVQLRLQSAPPADAIDDVILRRGSTRRFGHRPISFEQLSALLRCSTKGLAADFLPEVDGAFQAARLSTPYLVINAVDGLEPGAYVYHAAEEALELLRAGDFRQQAGFLDLGQELAADAAINCYLLSDLGAVLGRFGDRGYRAAQMEAAMVGGKLYLASYALGLGATGLTFFDDDVTEFFSPHAAGNGVMFLNAIGRPAGKRGRRG